MVEEKVFRFIFPYEMRKVPLNVKNVEENPCVGELHLEGSVNQFSWSMIVVRP